MQYVINNSYKVTKNMLKFEYKTCDLKGFYSKLQDDESRSLFRAWLLRFFDENDEHIWKFTDTMFKKGYFSDEIAELIKLQRDGSEIVLYGAGSVGKYA